ncbi:Rieske 2Fe-2S domain-containing protein [Halorussus gelatinilyticus]|uniref:Rieske 2Fe-2S domain-containing protein n=1 Tax=Halorussus gelatinilyticus TaxID=2937524 RepID=A0A8U0IH13_9EURY|nr:Rieske 2Fe-2S domain-containing protein [Halorussus gelatinilyticus]UPW00005.1 Rieske 2Fe-2S domain-containing protein [Halorussus gelatinilyticus]
MTGRTRLTTTETVRDERSWLFTVRDQYDELDEVILVPCEEERTDGGATAESDDSAADADPDDPGVEAWINRCTHEAQRLDRGFGAAMRDGQIICPKHGSMFDACSGYCDNGDAADTTLPSVEVAVEDGAVYLADDGYEFVHEGSIEGGGEEAGDGDESQDDDDDMPSSTSHIGF